MVNVTLKNSDELKIIKPTIWLAKKMINYCNIIGGESDNLGYGKNEFAFSLWKEIKMIKSSQKSPRNIMFVGLIKGQVVSIINFGSRYWRRRMAHMGELGISVLKAYWNIGVGSAMMDTLIQYVQSQKIYTKMNLETKENNTNAIRLYEKFGFKIEGKIERALKINDEYYATLIMGKVLE